MQICFVHSHDSQVQFNDDMQQLAISYILWYSDDRLRRSGFCFFSCVKVIYKSCVMCRSSVTCYNILIIETLNVVTANRQRDFFSFISQEVYYSILCLQDTHFDHEIGIFSRNIMGDQFFCLYKRKIRNVLKT